MASTFSDLLKIELIGDGEQSGSWGTTTNNNFSQSLEHAVAGVLGVNTGSSTAVTLTTGNGPQAQADNQARQASLVFSGASANCVVTVPATQKIYFAHNTNASNTITLRLAGGTTDHVIPASTSVLVSTTGSAWHALTPGSFSAGGTISNTSGDITIDAVGDIILDADGANVTFKDGGTAIGDFSNSSSDFVITSSVQDKDIIFKGDDGGAGITALTLDMSAAGAATFNAGITATTGTFSGVVDADAGITVDNITIDGTEIDLSTGDLTLDVAGDIVLDAGGSDIRMSAAGTQFGIINGTSSNLTIFSTVSDKDVIIQGNDGGATITALTLDMSAAGAATFNDAVTASSFSGNGASLTALNGSNISSGTIDSARLPGSLGKVLQVVSTNTTSTTSSTSTSYTDVTGLSVAITPSASSSKILVFVTIGMIDDASGSNGTYAFRLLRDSTSIGEGSGGGQTDSIAGLGIETNNADNLNVHFLDSPSSTSSTTYKMQFRGLYNPAIRINTSQDNSGSLGNHTSASITAVEIGA